MSIRNKPRDAAIFGVDIGKTLFHNVTSQSRRTLIINAGNSETQTTTNLAIAPLLAKK